MSPPISMDASSLRAFLNDLCAELDAKRFHRLGLPAAAVLAVVGTGVGECKKTTVDTDTSPEICDDDVDNDEDGKVDCDDSDCATDEACEDPTTETDCDNDVDDDDDGDVDCEDADCAVACDTSIPKTETNCSDNVDNDKDGLTDCDDPDCDDDLDCLGDLYRAPPVY